MVSREVTFCPLAGLSKHVCVICSKDGLLISAYTLVSIGEHTAGGADYSPRGPEVALGGSGVSFSSSSVSTIAHSTVNAWQLFLRAAEMFFF